MFRPQRINELIEKRKMTKKEFCEMVGISLTTLNRTTEHGSEIGVTKLEKMADILKVSMDYFFDRDDYSNNGNVVVSKKDVDNSNNNTAINGNGHTVHLTYCDRREIEHLKELLVEKERMIQLLMHNQNISLPSDKE